MRIGIIAILLSLLSLTACSGKQGIPSLTGDTAASRQQTQRAAEELLASDSAGPIAAPTFPPELQAAAEHRPASPDQQDEDLVIRYRVDCDSPDAPELAEAFLRTSSLTRMQDTPIHTVMALEQRLRNSLGDGRDILHSYGYYSGNVEGWIEKRSAIQDVAGAEPAEGSKQPLVVRVIFKPGPQYTIGKTTVIRLDLEKDVEELPGAEAYAALTYTVIKPEEAGKLPRTLADIGLEPGSPAIAQDVLRAVDMAGDSFKNNGYPFARTAYTRYILDNEKLELEATVAINPFEFVRMGDIELRGGDNKVSPRYIKYLRTWKRGEPWSQTKIEAFRDSLRQSGLFQSIEINPSNRPNTEGEHPVITTLASAPERTIGASVRYDTSFGPGLQGFWEHRNFTGNGDLLRAELSLWKDLQELVTRYRFPFAFGKDYDFIAQAGAIRQNTDAYDLEAARVSAGVEWRASRHWSLSAQGTMEGGWIKDPDKSKREYLMLGIPLAANFSSVNSLLDATDGGRAMFSIAPYTGFYDEDFNVVRSRLDLHRFIPLVGEDTLVLALRGSIGGLFGSDAPEVPPSVRFYSGGGGSVRGYEYQSLGPRNADKDPLGGSGMLEMSIEPRYKINETFGLVAFLDGGMVYNDLTDSRFAKDMQWGAGIGARLYTAIGPARFDIATPLNPRNGDDRLHFYISIGQSF